MASAMLAISSAIRCSPRSRRVFRIALQYGQGRAQGMGEVGRSRTGLGDRRFLRHQEQVDLGREGKHLVGGTRLPIASAVHRAHRPAGCGRHPGA